MAKNSSTPGGTLSDINDQSNKIKWRGKVWSSEGKFGRKIESKTSTNEEIAHFLQSGGTRANTTSQHPSVAPRIDVATTGKTLPVPQVSPSQMVDNYRRPKPRQNKGLRVKFKETAPEIIGEGGDEAEIPAREVFKSYKDHTKLAQVENQEHVFDSGKGLSQQSQEKLQWSSGSDKETSFRAPPLQRRPTTFEDLAIGSEYNDRDQDAAREVSPNNVSPEETHKPIPEPPFNQANANRGHTFNNYTIPMHRDHSPIRLVVDVDDGGVSPLDVPTTEIFASKSGNPRASPQAPTDYQVSPVSYHVGSQGSSVSDYDFPPVVPESLSPPIPPKSEHQIRRQPPRQLSADPNTKLLSLHDITKSLGDDSLVEFDLHMRRFNDLFRLGVSAHRDSHKISFLQWIRTAVWWFVRGRDGLESAVRSRSSNAAGSQVGNVLNQAWLNLAKAWWIISEITPTHPEIKRFGNAKMASILAIIKNFGDQGLGELVEAHLSVIASMRALTTSMKRNGMLPPHTFEIQSLDSRVLLEFPSLPSAFASLLINKASSAATDRGSYGFQTFFPILIGDTGRFFSFGRMFLEASLDCDGTPRNTHVPCVLSVIRERTDWGVKAAISSQDGQIDLVIQANQGGGFTWREVRWITKEHVVQIRLSKAVDLRLSFSEKDFNTLWAIYDYTRRVQKDFLPRKDEEVIFERNLKNLYCNGSSEFPSDPVPHCRLRLFEKTNGIVGDLGQQKTHTGYRLMIVTPPEKKTLSSVKYDFGKEQPVLFSYVKDKSGHRLSLRISSNESLSPIFHETPDHELFRSLLCGTFISKEDSAYGTLRLRNLSVMRVSNDQLSRPSDEHTGMQGFHKLRIVDGGPSPANGSRPATRGSGSFRIIAESDIGTLTDRLSLAPGELQINLSVENLNEIILLRPPQQNMTWSMLDGKVSEEELDSLRQTLQMMATSRTTRTYHFLSMSTLHSFQAIISGYQVLFDMPVTNFAISRKSMVSMHKRWEATSVRLQVLKNNKDTQLVTFFENFSHGACMNLVLKTTDIFEVFGRSGMFYLCLADAKFALPKGEDDHTRKFLCLDSPEYPGEHDDITIGFDNEQDRDRLGESLPAPVTKISRMASLRR